MSRPMSEGEPSNGSPWTAWLGNLNRAPSFDQSQKWLSERLDKLVRSDGFLSKIGKAMEGSLVFKAQMDRVIEQSLRSMRLPTTGDLDQIFARLDELDRRLESIERGQAQPAQGKAPQKKASARTGGKKG